MFLWMKKNEIILFENQGVKLEVNLKDYMLKGYAVNQKRLEYLEKTVKLIDIANRIDERRLQIYGECKKM